MSFRIDLVGDAAAFDAVYRAAGNQRDNLCGCYWAHLACVAFGGSSEPDEESAALAAGCVVPDGPTRPEFSLPWGGTHPGAQPTYPYRLVLPTSTDDDAIGTSPAGVAKAVTAMSGGSLVTVPLCSSEWTGDQVARLIEGLASLGRVPLVAVANVATRHLVGALGQSFVSMLDVLAGRAVLDQPADWDVGHFASLAGVAVGARGGYVVWRDTYKPMGERGYSLQPLDAVAAALHRDGTGAGGVLVLTTPVLADAVRGLAASLDLSETLWSNGSP